MNVLMMTLLYPPEIYADVELASKNGMQNQIDSYQKAFFEGLLQCMGEDEQLQAINALPVGTYPLQYRRLFLKRGLYWCNRVEELGCINLPGVKQRMREKRAEKALLQWAQASEKNRTVLLYTLYLPYLKAIAAVKRQIPDLKAAVIVTDLPNEYGLPSGRKGFLKQLEQRMGEQQLMLAREMDGFVLLTEHMAEVLPCEGKQQLIIEGLYRVGCEEHDTTQKDDQPFEVLYTGTLSPQLGIREMMEAFALMPDTLLRICGAGVMQKEVKAFAKKHSNIVFEGFVTHEKALILQGRANALINPRSPEGVFTRYSFPSKTLEYMYAGKPVICHRLEGIPAEYDPYLQYIEAPGAEGICSAVAALRNKTAQQRQQLGEAARAFVIEQKSSQVQCEKLLRWLRSL